MVEQAGRLQRSNRYIPGMRVQIRAAQWRIDRVDVPTHGGMLLSSRAMTNSCVAERRCFTELENDIKL